MQDARIPRSRALIIAPTRSTCLNIVATITSRSLPRTLLEEVCGARLTSAVNRLIEHHEGFGVVAGTGTGKTVGIKTMLQHYHGEDLRVGIVTSEHEITPEVMATANTLVITPGIAFNWVRRGFIAPTDLIVVDEIHQTSFHLHMTLALLRRQGNSFLWLSATIDPQMYRQYLRSHTLIECQAFDPARRVQYGAQDFETYLFDNLSRYQRERRGVAVFVPTRDRAEQLARMVERRCPSMLSMFYHAGVEVKKLTPFLDGTVVRPYIVFMTPAGASSLNIAGLDTVLIVDEQFTQVVQNGRSMTVSRWLDTNTLLQMIGRVDGRALQGEAIVFTERSIDFDELKPCAPELCLNADLPHVVLTCVEMGYEPGELQFLDDIDYVQCAELLSYFRTRGLVERDSLALTLYGKRVARLPLSPQWGELLIQAYEQEQYAPLRDVLLFVAAATSLYAFTRGNRRCLDDKESGVCAVSASDHLTIYNLVLRGLVEAGSLVSGAKAYFLNQDVLRAWCEKFGCQARPFMEVILAVRSIADALGLQSLPDLGTLQPIGDLDERLGLFQDLLARTHSLDIAGPLLPGNVLPAKNSMVDPQSDTVVGTIRDWVDNQGFKRQSIEGTVLPPEIMKRHATGCTIESVLAVVGARQFLVCVNMVFAGKNFRGAEVVVSPEELPSNLYAAGSNLLKGWLYQQFVTATVS